MPFIQHAYQQRAGKGNAQHAKPLQPTGEPDSTRKYGECHAMKKLIQRRGEQIDSNWLRSPKKKIQYHPHHQQCSSDA